MGRTAHTHTCLPRSHVSLSWPSWRTAFCFSSLAECWRGTSRQAPHMKDAFHDKPRPPFASAMAFHSLGHILAAGLGDGGPLASHAALVSAAVFGGFRTAMGNNRGRHARKRSRAEPCARLLRTRSWYYGRNPAGDRKSTRLNSSHDQISYAVFCLKKKKKKYYFCCPIMKTKTCKRLTGTFVNT